MTQNRAEVGNFQDLLSRIGAGLDHFLKFEYPDAQAKLNAIARQLNERPRKKLGYETPAERFNACVALTG